MKFDTTIARGIVSEVRRQLREKDDPATFGQIAACDIVLDLLKDGGRLDDA